MRLKRDGESNSEKNSDREVEREKKRERERERERERALVSARFWREDVETLEGTQ